MYCFAPFIVWLATLACGAPGGGCHKVQVPSHILYGVGSTIAWDTSATQRAEIIEKAKELHARVMRVELLWTWIEYSKGHRNWKVIDDIVGRLNAVGIQPLLVVAGSPPWASGVPESRDKFFYSYVPADPVGFQRWVAAYTDFIADAAQRYRGKVKLWEIGNEENDAYFWRPAPNVAQYATWYAAMRAAIKKVDPSSTVALGGLNGLGYDMDPPGMRGTAFLAGVYERHVFPDVVAIHPYSNRGQPPDMHLARAGNFDDIMLVHDVMAKYGQGKTPIWITEWGWSVNSVTPGEQAQYLRKSFQLLESKYAPYVMLATYYTAFDPSATDHYGLYTKEFSARPAATVFRDFMATR